MLNREIFEQHMGEVCLLTGHNPPVKQMNAIYKRIEENEAPDFINACNDDDMLEEFTLRKINYPTLKRFVMKHRTMRIERENTEAKRKEIEELRESIRNDSLPSFVRDFIKGLKRV
jgi:hypothetical protein